MATRSAVEAKLWSVPLFARCTAKDLKILARQIDTELVAAGADVVREGDHGDTFYVVLSGEAGVWRTGERVGTVGPGDHFGELALLDPAPRAATVRADTNMELGTFQYKTFLVVLKDLPAVASGLLAAMAGQLRQSHGVESNHPWNL
jgi:CRP/FNR family transcriptional regulator, cyclic AMP receptor protein